MGVPYEHHGRAKHVAVDCAGLVIGVGRELGSMDHNDFAYSEFPKEDYLLTECGKVLEKVALVKEVGYEETVQHVAPGVVIVVWARNPNEAQHMAVIGEHNGRMTMIHAFSKRGKVVEHGIDKFWLTRIMGVYHYPGVEYGAQD